LVQRPTLVYFSYWRLYWVLSYPFITVSGRKSRSLVPVFIESNIHRFNTDVIQWKWNLHSSVPLHEFSPLRISELESPIRESGIKIFLMSPHLLVYGLKWSVQPNQWSFTEIWSRRISVVTSDMTTMHRKSFAWASHQFPAIFLFLSGCRKMT